MSSHLRSDPQVKAAIVEQLDQRDKLVAAESPANLQMILGIGGARRHFKRALSSLIFKDSRVRRCHINGDRHYRLVGTPKVAELR